MMRIQFEWSGGYANLNIQLHVDSDELPPDLSERLVQTIRESRFFELQPKEVQARGFGPPDVFTYRISLTDAGLTNTLVCNDVTAPESLQPLLALLRDLALQQRQD